MDIVILTLSLVITWTLLYPHEIYYYIPAGVQLREGRRPPMSFFGNKKNALILKKKAPIVSILELNLPLKM